MTQDLDKKDWKLLHFLCTNARTSQNRIGKALSLSRNAVDYKIDRLRKRGIISGFVTIVNHGLLGYQFFQVMLKVNTKEYSPLIEYITTNKQAIVADRLMGEWDFILEIGAKDIQGLNHVMDVIKEKFPGIIETYEVHLVSNPFKVEQLPIELIQDKPTDVRPFSNEQAAVKIDNLDRRILFELNQDCTVQATALAQKFKVTYETIAARIKRLIKQNVILRFTARIDIQKLGYTLYFVRIEMVNLSKQRESQIRDYLIHNKKVRYAFISGTSPILFMYLAVKDVNELDLTINLIKERFSESIHRISYMLIREQLKYNLFPEGFLEN